MYNQLNEFKDRHGIAVSQRTNQARSSVRGFSANELRTATPFRNWLAIACLPSELGGSDC